MSALATRVGKLESVNILNPTIPIICVHMVHPQGPYSNTTEAQFDGITLHRQPDETADEFKTRAKTAATAAKPGGIPLVVFSGPAPAEPSAPMTINTRLEALESNADTAQSTLLVIGQPTAEQQAMLESGKYHAAAFLPDNHRDSRVRAVVITGVPEQQP